MARLNDTDALTSAASRGGESHSISTRKVDNGWIVSETTCTDTGEYKSREYFSTSPPRVIPGRIAYERNGDRGLDSAGSRGLKDAVDYATSPSGVQKGT